jgi:hypothetical protein
MYTLNTWLLANLLHPVIAVICWIKKSDSSFEVIVGGSFQLFIFTLVFSLPFLLISAVIIQLIKKIPLTSINKYLVWLFLATSLPFIGMLTISLVFEDINMEDLPLILPATLSVLIAILIRYKAFFKMLNKTLVTE